MCSPRVGVARKAGFNAAQLIPFITSARLQDQLAAYSGKILEG
ncbi:MAG: hypothetical protein ABSD53_21175 [Terriglobales bacterium]